MSIPATGVNQKLFIQLASYQRRIWLEDTDLWEFERYNWTFIEHVHLLVHKKDDLNQWFFFFSQLFV